MQHPPPLAPRFAFACRRRLRGIAGATPRSPRSPTANGARCSPPARSMGQRQLRRQECLARPPTLIKLTGFRQMGVQRRRASTHEATGATTADHQNFTGLYNQRHHATVVRLRTTRPRCATSRATSRRASRPAAGLGYHVVKKPDQTFDISAGLAYTWDRYRTPAGRLRTNCAAATTTLELLLAEESNNKLSDTTTFKQKLTIYPSISDGDGVRTSVRRGPVGRDDQAAGPHRHAVAPL